MGNLLSWLFGGRQEPDAEQDNGPENNDGDGPEDNNGGQPEDNNGTGPENQNDDEVVLVKNGGDGPEDNDNGEEFAVERILARADIDGEPHYLIQWQDFDDSHNSWEPEGNLSCPDLLAEFERSWDAKTETPRYWKKRSHRARKSTMNEDYKSPRKVRDGRRRNAERVRPNSALTAVAEENQEGRWNGVTPRIIGFLGRLLISIFIIYWTLQFARLYVNMRGFW